MIHPCQMRAARALLNWSQTKLAEEAQVSIMSVKNFERSSTDARQGTISKMEKALNEAGVEFIEGGVRQRCENR